MKDRRFWAPGTGEAAGGNGETRSEEEPARQEYPTYVEQLRADLAAKDQQLREYIAAYKEQIVKGIEDTKQRLDREQKRELERLRGQLVGDLLEVLDNLDRTLEVAGDRRDPVVDGVRLVRDQFAAKLAALGLEKIESLGQRFDPALHEAVALAPVAEPERDGSVVAVLKAGYRFGDKVLRPATVQVGKLAT